MVETGTYVGTMVAAVRQCFDAIYSIELDPSLAATAARRFARSGNVTVVQGDSAVMLGDILRGLDRPALFWLDAHFSGGITASAGTGSPVLDEIALISRHHLGAKHSILIDDARLFNGTSGYPAISTLMHSIAERFPLHHIHVECDVVALTPQESAMIPQGSLEAAPA